MPEFTSIQSIDDILHFLVLSPQNCLQNTEYSEPRSLSRADSSVECVSSYVVGSVGCAKATLRATMRSDYQITTTNLPTTAGTYVVSRCTA